MTCPICHAERPTEPHLDWCTYDGPEPDDEARLQWNVESTYVDDDIRETFRTVFGVEFPERT